MKEYQFAVVLVAQGKPIGKAWRMWDRENADKWAATLNACIADRLDDGFAYQVLAFRRGRHLAS